MLVAVVIAALALFLCLSLKEDQAYSDFIVGNLTWYAGTKLQDIVVAPVFVIVFFCVLLFFSSLIKWQKRLFGIGPAAELSSQLIWWSLPSIAAISSLILGAPLDERILQFSVFGIGFIAIAAIASAIKSFEIDPRVFSLVALSIILLSLVNLEISLVIGRAPISMFGHLDLSNYAGPFYSIALFGWFAGLLYVFFKPDFFARKMSWLLLASQLGITVFYLTLYPAHLRQPDASLSNYETTVWLKVLVIGMVVWGIVDVVRRFRIYSASKDFSKILSPIAFFGLLIGLKAGVTTSPSINPDDYHFGEIILGWWSYLQGVIPYVGYMPAHGIMGDDFTQLLSFLFYDGSAGSMAEAGRLSFAILAFVAFLSIFYFSSSIGLGFVSIFFLVGTFNWLFLTPFLCLWLSRRLLKRPAQWFFAWAITAPIVILGLPAQGLLLVVASGIVAAYYAWQMWRKPEERKFTGTLIAVAVLVVLGFASPLGSMLLGAVRYVLENGPLNQVAYGVPWSMSWSYTGKSGFIFEALRMSWIAVPLGCLLFILNWSKDCNRRIQTLFPLLVVLLFTLLLIPYSMGRIDIGNVSRPGLVASFSWMILLPIAAWGVLSHSGRVILIVLAASMSAALGFPSLSFSNLYASASASVMTSTLRDGRSAGLPNIGRASVQDEHWERLTKLARVLAEKVPKGQTYLDLTSRNAQYFYLGYRPPLPVTAPYNMVSPAQQRRAVDILREYAPDIALLEGNNIIHDGGGLALRNPYLYRFIVENYDPAYEKGFILGYKKKGSPAAVQPSVIEISLKEITDSNWIQGIYRSAPALLVDDQILFSLIKVGDQIRTADGEIRRIQRVSGENQTLWLEGSSFAPSDAQPVNSVQLIASPEVVSEYKLALLQKSFAQSELGKIPVAWGRSEKSLAKRMNLIKSLDGLQPTLHDLITENGRYKVSGIDPYLSFDLAGLDISGSDAGLLRFDFECSGRIGDTRLQVFWWGDVSPGPNENSSIHFSPENGTLIVPLDASPRWLTLKRLKGIRVDLDNSAACKDIRVRNVALMQRKL